MAPEGRYRFGFTDKDKMFRYFGLHEPIYLKQFTELLKTPQFKISAYLVKPIAISDSEIMFQHSEAEFLETVKTIEEFYKL